MSDLSVLEYIRAASNNTILACFDTYFLEQAGLLEADGAGVCTENDTPSPDLQVVVDRSPRRDHPSTV